MSQRSQGELVYLYGMCIQVGGDRPPSPGPYFVDRSTWQVLKTLSPSAIVLALQLSKSVDGTIII